MLLLIFLFFFFKQKTAYEMLRSLVGSEMCIRDRSRKPLSNGSKTGLLERQFDRVINHAR